MISFSADASRWSVSCEVNPPQRGAMNISSGIAEISFPRVGNYNKTEKTTLWPVYDAGKVDPIFRVTRELDGQIFYTKPTNEERDRLLQTADKTPRDSGYNELGGKKRASAFLPGTFFDAYV
jgi:hypothetical protein